MFILLQGGFGEGFIEPYFWYIVTFLIVVAVAVCFAFWKVFKWIHRESPTKPARRGFPVVPDANATRPEDHS